jgi:hypothetical protein
VAFFLAKVENIRIVQANPYVELVSLHLNFSIEQMCDHWDYNIQLKMYRKTFNIDFEDVTYPSLAYASVSYTSVAYATITYASVAYTSITYTSILTS